MGGVRVYIRVIEASAVSSGIKGMSESRRCELWSADVEEGAPHIGWVKRNYPSTLLLCLSTFLLCTIVLVLAVSYHKPIGWRPGPQIGTAFKRQSLVKGTLIFLVCYEMPLGPSFFIYFFSLLSAIISPPILVFTPWPWGKRIFLLPPTWHDMPSHSPVLKGQ